MDFVELNLTTKESTERMISKNRIKLIKSLERKKARLEEGLFVAEGPKVLEELLGTEAPVYVAATQKWMDANAAIFKTLSAKGTAFDVVTDDELTKASLLKTPQQVIALFRLPKDVYGEVNNAEGNVALKATKDEETGHGECRTHAATTLAEASQSQLVLALDGVQDPGNVGTILRLADWFGIEHVYCSADTADAYSPKTVQATMGAIARVHVHYINLHGALKECKSPIYGTHLDGENIYGKTLTPNGVVVMGNEGKGISPEIASLVNSRLYIPPYPTDRDKVESLNVAIATAIVCAEFRRRG